MGWYRIFQEQVIFLEHDKIQLNVSLVVQLQNVAIKHILLAETRENRRVVAVAAVFSLCLWLFSFRFVLIFFCCFFLSFVFCQTNSLWQWAGEVKLLLRLGNVWKTMCEILIWQGWTDWWGHGDILWSEAICAQCVWKKPCNNGSGKRSQSGDNTLLFSSVNEGGVESILPFSITGRLY